MVVTLSRFSRLSSFYLPLPRFYFYPLFFPLSSSYFIHISALLPSFSIWFFLFLVSVSSSLFPLFPLCLNLIHLCRCFPFLFPFALIYHYFYLLTVDDFFPSFLFPLPASFFFSSRIHSLLNCGRCLLFSSFTSFSSSLLFLHLFFLYSSTFVPPLSPSLLFQLFLFYSFTSFTSPLPPPLSPSLYLGHLFLPPLPGGAPFQRPV